jgi:hypothetical protein
VSRAWGTSAGRRWNTTTATLRTCRTCSGLARARSPHRIRRARRCVGQALPPGRSALLGGTGRAAGADRSRLRPCRAPPARGGRLDPALGRPASGCPPAGSLRWRPRLLALLDAPIRACAGLRPSWWPAAPGTRSRRRRRCASGTPARVRHQNRPLRTNAPRAGSAAICEVLIPLREHSGVLLGPLAARRDLAPNLCTVVTAWGPAAAAALPALVDAAAEPALRPSAARALAPRRSRCRPASARPSRSPEAIACRSAPRHCTTSPSSARPATGCEPWPGPSPPRFSIDPVHGRDAERR